MESLHIQRRGEALEFSYDIVWEKGFAGIAPCIRHLSLAARKACVVTDSQVGELYLPEIMEHLSGCFSQTDSFVFPAGEENKTLHTVQSLYEFLISKKYERRDLLIALGGGVVGDLTGFSAATYLRGIDFIQVPTTLLAQVDSSIGGKTGVDFSKYKNMVGAFYQPRLVYMNMEVLRSLPERQFAGGMGEVLKTALIRDKSFYNWILDNQAGINQRDPDLLSSMIRRCCEIKAAVVEEDPKEQGVRAVLNLGHTLGHAVEKLKDFRLQHGECVALGTSAAAYLSLKRGFISKEEYESVLRGIAAFHLPSHVSGLRAEEILQASKSDKKMESGKIKFILLHPLGRAVIDPTVSDEEILEAVRTIQKSGEDTI